MATDKTRGGITRRELLAGAGVALATAAFPFGDVTAKQATPTRDIRGTELTILQWRHFVPSYDAWFDPFAKAWGEANGVKVTVDHINASDVPTTFAAEIAARQGHDLVEYNVPLANLEPSLLDLSDVIAEANRRHGPQSGICHLSTYNPTTNHMYGFVHGWAPDPGDYRKSLWEKAGLPNGPATYQELLDTGKKITDEQGVHMGIGMSNEADSDMAALALLWSFGASVQDAHENVVLNSPETIAAVEYMVQLYKATMTPEVFGWNEASNNQLLVAGRASYILNSISAYRTAQIQQPEIAKDIFFTPALKGPTGIGLVNGHAIINYMLPYYSKYPDTAKEFLLYLVANYDQATRQSKLYNLPAWPGAAPEVFQEGGPLDHDPYGSQPDTKLSILRTATSWSTHLGYPGPSNAVAGEVSAEYLLPKMLARAAQGERPQTVVADTAKQIQAIADKWRKQGLIGGAK